MSENSNKYQNGRIYKVVCGDLTYIGSTCQPLSKRMAEYRRHYFGYTGGSERKYLRIYEVIEEALHKKVKPDIILIEAYACNSKEELDARKHHFINTMKCINKVDFARPSNGVKHFESVDTKLNTSTTPDDS